MGLTTHVVTVVTECLREVSIFRHEQFAQNLVMQGRLGQHVKCDCMIALYCICTRQVMFTAHSLELVIPSVFSGQFKSSEQWYLYGTN